MRRPLLLALALTACAHTPLRFRDSPADYVQLGITEAVDVSEDGRRTRAGTDEYEWWYLDGVAKDGTVVVVVFADNWLPGERRRKVMMDINQPGKPTRRGIFKSPAPGEFSRARADVRIGASRFEGDLAHYTIDVAPNELQGIGCHLELERRVPSYRPGTGVLSSGDAFFAWVVAVPEGALKGTLTIDGREIAFSGSGYHDHNWGNVAPWALLRNWWWGRGEIDGRTVVISEMRPAKGRGDQAMALLYVAGPDGVVANKHGTSARLIEGPPAPNDDPHHPELQPAHVTLEASDAVSARFVRHGAPLASADLLAEMPAFTRFLGRLAGRSPWYTRWSSTVSVDTQGFSGRGEGTIEFMDFE
jgi:hypothetical protein